MEECIRYNKWHNEDSAVEGTWWIQELKVHVTDTVNKRHFGIRSWSLLILPSSYLLIVFISLCPHSYHLLESRIKYRSLLEWSICWLFGLTISHLPPTINCLHSNQWSFPNTNYIMSLLYLSPINGISLSHWKIELPEWSGLTHFSNLLSHYSSPMPQSFVTLASLFLQKHLYKLLPLQRSFLYLQLVTRCGFYKENVGNEKHPQLD